MVYGIVWHGMVWLLAWNMVWYDMFIRVEYRMVQFGMACHGMVWHVV